MDQIDAFFLHEGGKTIRDPAVGNSLGKLAAKIFALFRRAVQTIRFRDVYGPNVLQTIPFLQRALLPMGDKRFERDRSSRDKS